MRSGGPSGQNEAYPPSPLNRLEALGARQLGLVKRWWVLEAPTGQRFCVANPQRGSLRGRADEWP